ncbi:MAG: DUF4382 domain-containing protein [Pseudomonadota bacterium]
MNTFPIRKRPGTSILAGAMLAIAGCGGGGAGDGAGTGTLSLQITDGPVESAKHVYVQFSGLELHAADGQHTTLYYCQDPADATNPPIVSETACTTTPAPKKIDLLAQTGGVAEDLLVDFTLPSGRYNWIRLMVDAVAGTQDSYIVLLDDSEHELEIPSGAETGLKLNRGFVVPAGGSADFTIDFDLRKSVHFTGTDPGTGEYMLRPTLRLADNSMTGAIAGTVHQSLVLAGCTPAVYVYEGSGVAPDDIDTDPNTLDPVTTATVKLDNGTYRYKAAYLEAGTYTVAFTCNAGADDPTTNNVLTFADTTADADNEFDTVTVTAKTETIHNF